MLVVLGLAGTGSAEPAAGAPGRTSPRRSTTSSAVATIGAPVATSTVAPKTVVTVVTGVTSTVVPPVAVTTARAAPTTVAAPTTLPPPTYPPVTVKRTTPVRGPIVDPWRPPTTPYGPGNRGIDIGTVPGAIVVSPADGVVTFAGMVGDSRFVVVQSADGIRITIGFLAAVRVRSGQTVRRGQAIGRAGTSVHVGARVDDDYLDPTPLFSGGPPHVRLIAVGEGPRGKSARSSG